MNKKVILASLVAGMAASSALAVEKGPTVTLGGSLDTQVGVRNEKGNNKFVAQTQATGKRHTTAIANDTRLHVKVDGKAHGMSYGGKVVLNADTSNNKFQNTDSNKIGYETVVYAESYMGRLEAGSTAGVTDSFNVSAASIAKASGGASLGDARFWVNPVNNTNFVTNEGFYSNAQTGGSANAAKVSYKTPSYNGLRLGVSYIPDMEQKGTVTQTHLVANNALTAANIVNGVSQQTNAFKNVVSGGVTYDGKFNHFGVKAAVLGENGSAKKAFPADANSYRKLSSVQGGLAASYQGYSLAGSYADLGKSGLAKGVNTKKSNYWTAGVAYDHHKFGASVTYFESKKGAKVGTAQKYNKQKNWSVGVDYKLAPGFMPYVEYTNFDQKFANPADANNNSRGNVILAGTKLHF